MRDPFPGNAEKGDHYSTEGHLEYAKFRPTNHWNAGKKPKVYQSVERHSSQLASDCFGLSVRPVGQYYESGRRFNGRGTH
jgi:hypothetical protein